MKVAIVIGGAECVWADYEQTKALLGPIVEYKDWTTFVINDSIPLFPDWVDHAVSLHPNKFKDWAHKRNELKLNIPYRVWAHRAAPLVTDHTKDWGGSSGLFACKVALELGYRRIILCGVPMDEKAKHIVRGVPWQPARAFWRAWETHMKDIKGFVKSFSGRSCGHLGAPTLEWLNAPLDNTAA